MIIMVVMIIMNIMIVMIVIIIEIRIMIMIIRGPVYPTKAGGPNQQLLKIRPKPTAFVK